MYATLRLIATFAFALLMTSVGRANDDANTASLFDGKTLEQWTVLRCDAKVQDGAILLKGGNGVVQTEQQYANFVFECEWKTLKADKWDSGIYFRYTSIPANRPWPDRYQVNLGEGMEGNLVGFKEAENRVEVKPHAWNQFVLTVKGDTAELKVNGKQAWRAKGLKTLKGFIALQAEVPLGGQFLFRNIRITKLP